MPGKLLAVTGKHTHFGSYSGYNRLYHYLQELMPVIIHQNKMKSWEKKWAKKLALRNFRSSKYGLYHNTTHLFTEYEAFKTAKKIKPDYLHIAFLEDTLGFLADCKKRLPCKLFATSHQPPEWWQMTQKNTAILQALDGLIVLSNDAKTFFEQYIPGKVIYIPHGIDTVFFNYEKHKKNTSAKHILLVGSWMRDLETFVRTIELLEKRQKGKFLYDIVYPDTPDSPTNPLQRLLKNSNVYWYKNISNTQLRQLYYNADVLFIPFINATANNALLEAASCGTPILTTRLSSILDCFGNDNYLFTADGCDVETYFKCIQYISDDRNYDEVTDKTVHLNGYVKQNLDWEIIAKRHQIFFESN